MKKKSETTSIIWDDAYEEYKCAECGSIISYNLGFRYCPFCRRKVVRTDARRSKTSLGVAKGLLIR